MLNHRWCCLSMNVQPRHMFRRRMANRFGDTTFVVDRVVSEVCTGNPCSPVAFYFIIYSRLLLYTWVFCFLVYAKTSVCQLCNRRTKFNLFVFYKHLSWILKTMHKNVAQCLLLPTPEVFSVGTLVVFSCSKAKTCGIMLCMHYTAAGLYGKQELRQAFTAFAPVSYAYVRERINIFFSA